VAVAAPSLDVRSPEGLSAALPDPSVPYYHLPQGAPLKSRVAYAIFRAIGWKLRYGNSADIHHGLRFAHGVLIVYPHTSNWDFVIAILAKWSVDLPVRFVGKDTLFSGPLGWWFRYLGGRPVNRAQASGAVDELAALIKAEPWCWLALSPEGTRAALPAWRSGFYHVAKRANVPVAMAYLDFASKEVGIAGFMRLTEDTEADIARIAQAFAGRRGYKPSGESPIRLGAAPPDAP
jgi:1-acyl-sn-glycerol-3-phosphate acyltransferase